MNIQKWTEINFANANKMHGWNNWTAAASDEIIAKSCERTLSVVGYQSNLVDDDNDDDDFDDNDNNNNLAYDILVYEL